MSVTIRRRVTLRGLVPIMFDRYAGNNNEQLPTMKKVYVSSEDGKTLVFPSINLMSFLSAQNNESAPQRVMGKRWKTVCKAAASYVQIEPLEIPFLRNGKPLTIDNANLRVHFAVARMRKGPLIIPNPKERPVMDCPWSLAFDVSLFETTDLSEEVLKKLFEQGGMAIGLGTWRGVFGKFAVEKWEETE